MVYKMVVGVEGLLSESAIAAPAALCVEVVVTDGADYAAAAVAALMAAWVPQEQLGV